MAQGSLKKVAKPAKKNARQKQVKMKKGSRTIAPKQHVLVKQKSLEKKLTAQINKNIEKQMSVKANAIGKLTIMKKTAESSALEMKDKKKNITMVGHFNNSDSCAQEQPLIAPIATTCVLTTTADGTKKKVRLNTKVEYMDVDDGSDMHSVGSPDLDKLDGDGDYVCPYDSDDSDSEEDDTTADPITESNLGINSDKTTTDTDCDEVKDELHIMYDLQVGTGDEDCDDADKFVDEDKRFLLGFELHHFNLGTDTGTDTINLPIDETTSDEMDLHNNLAMGLVNALRNSSTKSDKQKGKQLRAELKIRMSDKPSMQKITKRKTKNKLGKTRKKSSSKKKPKQKTKVRKNHSCSRKQNPVAIDVDTVGGKSNIEIVSTVD